MEISTGKAASYARVGYRGRKYRDQVRKNPIAVRILFFIIYYTISNSHIFSYDNSSPVIHCSVVAVSKAAFALLGNFDNPTAAAEKAAIMKLCDLNKVGPATSVALLSPLVGSLPYMCDEVLEASTGRRDPYNHPHYAEMKDELQRLAQQVKKLDSKDWTLENLQRALWAHGVLQCATPVEKEEVAPPTKKRKL